jgi:alpha-beta hydrolase superfamily lysophospholipase
MTIPGRNYADMMDRSPWLLALLLALCVLLGAAPASGGEGAARPALLSAPAHDAAPAGERPWGTRFAVGLARKVAAAVVFALIGGLVVLVVVLVVAVRNMPSLEIWHTANLDEEFTARSRVRTFADYLQREERVFEQVEREVFARAERGPANALGRYERGLADPARWELNWNRTFEWAPEAPTGGVLLVHGMSDAPYSLRSLGRRLHEAGAHVIGLRLPGHGTAPAGLVGVRWEDMTAAVRLGMAHLAEQVGAAPRYIVGYSNGAALAVEYALEAIDDPSMPQADGLIMLSPAIGVSRLAALAAWQERVARVAGARGLSWRAIAPECNPYKYDSFAINGARQTHRLTTEIQSRIAKLDAAGGLDRLPRVLAFQSIADATVSPAAVIDGLFARLPAGGGHELVVFDINRCAHIEHLLNSDPLEELLARLEVPDRRYECTLVTNEDSSSTAVVARRTEAGGREVTEPLGARWPDGVYSLSHLALPFSPDDPLYGNAAAEPGPGPGLGTIAMRGERGVLQIPASYMLRLRWNPFYDYVEQRVTAFTSAARG